MRRPQCVKGDNIRHEVLNNILAMCIDEHKTVEEVCVSLDRRNSTIANYLRFLEHNGFMSRTSARGGIRNAEFHYYRTIKSNITLEESLVKVSLLIRDRPAKALPPNTRQFILSDKESPTDSYSKNHMLQMQENRKKEKERGYGKVYVGSTFGIV